MTPVPAALAFVAMYVATALLCGTGLKRLVASVQEHVNAAGFLIGTAFTPFAIGLLYGALLIAAPGLRHPAHAALQIAVCVIVCAVMGGRAARETCRTALTLWLLAIRRGPRWRAAALGILGGTFLLLLVFACDSALAPVYHHDETVYALDARRVVEEGRIDALLTHTPDRNNQLSNNNHGSSYQLYLAAALAFSGDPIQDFPLRVAQELLPLHLAVAVMALALLVRPLAAVFAPILLLYVNSYGYMITAASRDPYRLLAIVIVAALVATPGMILKGAGLALGTLAFAFLWNAHTSALLFAPTLTGVALMLASSWRARLMIAVAFAVGLAIGGIRLTVAYARTGDFTSGSFDYYSFLAGTPLLGEMLEARGAPPVGFRGVLPRLNQYFSTDGRMLVTATAIGLAFVAVAVVRGSPVPLLVRLSALFILMLGLQIGGLFDWVDRRIGTLLAINLRYRLTLYPFVAVLLSWIAARAISEVPRILRHAVPVCVALVITVGVWNTQRHWGFQPLPYFTDAAAANEFLAEEDSYYSFLHLFKAIPQEALILMDPAYYGWYHSRNRIIALFDPRIREAIVAPDTASALRVLDQVGVTYVVLPDYDINALRLAPLVQALASPDFSLVGHGGSWRVYHRAGPRLGPAAVP